MSTEQAAAIDEASNKVTTYLEQYGPKILLSIVLFFVFTKLINVLVLALDNFMSKRKIDPKVSSMAINLTKYVMYLILVLFLATFIGIDVAYIILLIIAFIAVIAFTMQNTLVNVGAGFVVIGLKLFKKGDYIESAEIEGNVKKIDIYHTEIIRSDNSIVFVPNSDLLNKIIVNTDKRSKKRVDIEVFVNFENDIDILRKLMLEVTKNDKRILEDTEPTVTVNDVDKISIKIRLSIWVKRDDYWDVLNDYNEKVINIFQKNNIAFPDKNIASWSQE
jgi:small conductance mechanosensitive channel